MMHREKVAGGRGHRNKNRSSENSEKCLNWYFKNQ